MLRNTLILIMLLAIGFAFAQNAADSTKTLPVDPDLKIGRLPNGLTYYIKVNRKPEKRAELRLITNIGSVQEDDDQQGLAHFTEHMAFNSTTHFKKSELVDYLNSIGMGYAAGLNAGTGLDQTVYQLTIPTDNEEQFQKGFLILSDWASGISFDTDELNKERGVIIEEWRMGQGADQRMYDAQRKVIFAGSKYAERMPIGKLEVLQNFTPETIKRFYHDWYRPDLQAVVAVGDFDATTVENLIKQYFNTIPKRDNPRECVLYDVPDHAEPKIVITTDKEATDTSVQLTWKHDKTENKTINEYRKTLIVNLYTQMLNMRLQELTQQADPPFSMAFNYNFNMVRSKSTYAMVAMIPETGIKTGLKALLTEADRVNRFGFTESELARNKQMMLRNSERMLAEKDKQDSDRLVWRYVGNFSFGNPVMSIEQNVTLNKMLYDGITLDEVNSVCRELVTDNNLVISVSAPQKDDLVIPTEQELLSLIQQVKTEEIAVYQDKVSAEELLQKELKPRKIVKEKSYSKVGIKQWTLSNGIKVLWKKTDFKNDEVLLKAFSPGGTSLYNLEDLFEAREADDIIVDSGVNGFDKSTLKKKLAGKIANVEPFINPDNEGFNANCSKADMETMFQLIYLYATAPRMDEESYTSWLSRTTAWMQNEALSPEAGFSDSINAMMFNNHPRTRTLKVEDLPNLDMNRVMQIYMERFADFTDFTFIVVGSFDEKILKGYCEKYLANLPAKGIREQARDNGVRFSQGKKELAIYKGQDPKSIVQMAFGGECVVDNMTNNKLRNLSLLVNEKLRENIREARSGVYFVGSWGSAYKHPVPYYLMFIYMQCAPDRVDELSEAVIMTLDSLKAGLFDPKYVNTVKVTLQKKMETDLTENRWWLDAVYDQAWNDFPMNDLLNDKKEINNINLKELQNIAAQYLKQDTNLVKGVLYPADMKE